MRSRGARSRRGFWLCRERGEGGTIDSHHWLRVEVKCGAVRRGLVAFSGLGRATAIKVVLYLRKSHRIGGEEREPLRMKEADYSSAQSLYSRLHALTCCAVLRCSMVDEQRCTRIGRV